MTGEIFGPELPIVLAVLLALSPVVVLPIWAAIDAAGRPDWAFDRAGTNKTLWIVLPVVGLLACGIVGIVAGILWFGSFRGKVDLACSGGNTFG